MSNEIILMIITTVMRIIAAANTEVVEDWDISQIFVSSSVLRAFNLGNES